MNASIPPASLKTDRSDIHLLPGGDAIMRYSAAGAVIELSCPSIDIDGKRHLLRPDRLDRAGEPKEIGNGAVEHTFRGEIGDSGLTLTLVLRIATDNPVVRFRYVLESATPRRLTKSNGRDAAEYFSVSLGDYPSAMEVRLSEFVEMVHAYCANEVALEPKDFAGGASAMGPILVAGNATHQLLLAYEHGSTHPDAFLEFSLGQGRSVALRAVKGNYPSGDSGTVGPDNPWETVWFNIAAVAGSADDLAAAFRRHVLRWLCPSRASREPYIFYNTWNAQQRHVRQKKGKLLDTVSQDRILADIDVAHRIGIEVFVIDTGWYEKTGDWRVDRRRFPDGLSAVKKKLDGYGMKLGLWFDNAAAMSSAALANHRDCVASHDEAEPRPQPIWETEEALRMCLVSRYWRDFADEMIRLVREVGVSYFKWDAIDQYACRRAGHEHGDSSNSIEERGDRHAFLLPRYLSKIAERVSAECPEAIVDFDMTEPNRIFGLEFLSAGKFFILNHGPYFSSFGIPGLPGPVLLEAGWQRNWVLRYPLSLDKWIPSNLLLTHFFPDDPAENQDNCAASLVLGQNGIWGDLQSISPAGVDRLHEALSQYKRVRHDVAAAPPITRGLPSGTPQWHEKINPQTGRGVICAFANRPGIYRYITERRVAPGEWCMAGASVMRLPDGRAEVTATFADRESAKMIVMGTRDESASHAKRT